MSDRLTSCGTSCQTTTREGALARLRYWCARRPAAAAAARRGLALYQLDMACFAAGRRGREVRRVEGNPHRSSDEFFIGRHDGRLIEEAVAGPYTIKHGAATVWPASGSSTSLMARPRS